VKRNKDQLRQILKDVKSSNESRVEQLEAKLALAREAIENAVSWVEDDYFDNCDAVELTEEQVRLLKNAIK
jgi:predicted DNA binding protein